MTAWSVVGSEVIQVPGTVLLGVHPAETCLGRSCTIHRPSTHPMRRWRLLWRGDREMFERICRHGIGHPDPDQIVYWDAILPPEDAEAQGVHGCDGCCSAPVGDQVCLAEGPSA